MQFPDDDNGKILTAMSEAGIDLSRHLDVDFFLVFEDQRDADFATKELANSDLEGEMELHLNDELGKWELIVCINMVPEYQAIVDQEIQLNHFAEEFGGATDGWGVMQNQEGDDEFADGDHVCSDSCKH